MLTQKIDKYQEPPWVSSQQMQGYQSTHNFHSPFKGFNILTPGQFELYLKQLQFKEGDYVVSKFARPPYNDLQVEVVRKIQTLHHCVVYWGTADGGPYILGLGGFHGGSLHWAGPGAYTTIKEDEIPPRWKERMNAHPSD
jgi:hypothetical protein